MLVVRSENGTQQSGVCCAQEALANLTGDVLDDESGPEYIEFEEQVILTMLEIVQ